MRDVSLVQVVYCKHNLLPKELGLDFSHLAIWFSFEIAVQRTSVHVLHYQKDLLVRFKSFIEFCKTLVVNLFHNFDFSLHALSSIRLQKLELVINFYSNLLIELLVQTYSDNCVCALADALAYDVVINIFNCAHLSAELVRFSKVNSRVVIVLVLVYLVCEMSVILLVFVLLILLVLTSCD